MTENQAQENPEGEPPPPPKTSQPILGCVALLVVGVGLILVIWGWCLMIVSVIDVFRPSVFPPGFWNLWNINSFLQLLAGIVFSVIGVRMMQVIKPKRN